MLVFVGLGNTDSRYLNTKHNVGFWAIDMFAKKHNLEFKAGKGDFVFAKKDNDYILVKPTTGMNRSGNMIQDILNFYKADIKDLVNLHKLISFIFIWLAVIIYLNELRKE